MSIHSSICLDPAPSALPSDSDDEESGKISIFPGTPVQRPAKSHVRRTLGPAIVPISLAQHPALGIKIVPDDTIEVIACLRSHVREIAEMLLGELADLEAVAICNAHKYTHSAERKYARNGSYIRKLRSSAGTLTLRLPILRNMPYRKSLIDRFKRYQKVIIAQLGDMFLRGASSSKLQAMIYLLWGPRPMPQALRHEGCKLAWKIETLRNALITIPPANLELRGVNITGAFIGEPARHVKVLTVFEKGGSTGRRIITMGIFEDDQLDEWVAFGRWLAARGLPNIQKIEAAS